MGTRRAAQGHGASGAGPGGEEAEHQLKKEGQEEALLCSWSLSKAEEKVLALLQHTQSYCSFCGDTVCTREPSAGGRTAGSAI